MSDDDRGLVAALVRKWKTDGIANLDLRTPREVLDICTAQLEAAVKHADAVPPTGDQLFGDTKVSLEQLDHELWEATRGLCRWWPYRHIKSGLTYRIEQFALRESDHVPVVVYSRFGPEHPPDFKYPMFVRPATEFRRAFEEVK